MDDDKVYTVGQNFFFNDYVYNQAQIMNSVNKRNLVTLS